MLLSRHDGGAAAVVVIIWNNNYFRIPLSFWSCPQKLGLTLDLDLVKNYCSIRH